MNKLGLLDKNNLPHGTKLDEWVLLCEELDCVNPEDKEILGWLHNSVPFDSANDMEGWFKSGDRLEENNTLQFVYMGGNSNYKDLFPRPQV